MKINIVSSVLVFSGLIIASYNLSASAQVSARVAPVVPSGLAALHLAHPAANLAAPALANSIGWTIERFHPLWSGEAYALVRKPDTLASLTVSRGKEFEFQLSEPASPGGVRTIKGVVTESWALYGNDVSIGVTEGNKTTFFPMSKVLSIISNPGAFFDGRR